MSYIYVAAPYSDDDINVVDQRVANIMQYVAQLFKQGNYAFSVVLHCHEMSKVHNIPKTYDFWEGYCETMISHCDCVHVLMIPGYEQSTGVNGEIDLANKYNKQIVYITPN